MELSDNQKKWNASFIGPGKWQRSSKHDKKSVVRVLLHSRACASRAAPTAPAEFTKE